MLSTSWNHSNTILTLRSVCNSTKWKFEITLLEGITNTVTNTAIWAISGRKRLDAGEAKRRQLSTTNPLQEANHCLKSPHNCTPLDYLKIHTIEYKKQHNISDHCDSLIIKTITPVLLSCAFSLIQSACCFLPHITFCSLRTVRLIEVTTTLEWKYSYADYVSFKYDLRWENA